MIRSVFFLDIPKKTCILVGMITQNPTRRKILESAYQQIHRNGFQAASLNPILARTGVTKGALYHHFPNKRALGYAVLDELIKEMVMQFWLRPLDNCSDPIDALKRRIREAGKSISKEDVLLGCPLNNLCLEMSPIDDGFRQRVNQIYEFWREGFARAFRTGQANGTVSARIDPMDCATFTVAALAGCRSLAKNAQSRELLTACGRNLIRYLETLRH
jgi:TetR/AcrR family transcriptional repressor of nem operon